MKKILSLVLCTALIAVFTGCTTTPAVEPSLEPSQGVETPAASPDIEPSIEPSTEPDLTPSDDPSQGGEDQPTVQSGSYGYTIAFDPALFAYASSDGLDKFAPLTDEHKDTQPTYLSVSKLTAEDAEAFETEKMGDKKTETTVGSAAYAASMAQTTTDSDGTAVTITNYVVKLESGDALSIEIASVGDTNTAALGAMLDSLVIE